MFQRQGRKDPRAVACGKPNMQQAFQLEPESESVHLAHPLAEEWSHVYCSECLMAQEDIDEVLQCR